MKHLVVTGGTGGLGSAIATEFQSAGWLVDAPGSTDLDVTDADAVTRYFDRRPVDLLVCAAGMTSDGPMLRQTADAWDTTMAVNFSGARICAQATLPGMISRGAGHILFISSHSAIHPPEGQVAYATAKAALLGLTRDLSAEYGSAGIRVNAILPGFLETRMTSQVTASRRAEVLAAHHLKRFNTPQAVASFVRCLEENLPHTSGQVFQLDSR